MRINPFGRVAMAGGTALALATTAFAAPIIDAPMFTDGNFTANVIHTVPTIGKGTILAYTGLDRTQASFYDPDAGTLSVHLDLFADAGKTTQIGTMMIGNDGLTDPIFASEFNQFDNQTIGPMDYRLELTNRSNGLASYLTSRGVDIAVPLNFTTTLIDANLMTTPSGLVANSYRLPSANTTAASNTSLTFPLYVNWDIEASLDLGFDNVWVVADRSFIDEPAALAIFVAGLAGLTVAARRKSYVRGAAELNS